MLQTMWARSPIMLLLLLKLVFVEVSTATLIGLEAAGVTRLPPAVWGVVGAINIADVVLVASSIGRQQSPSDIRQTPAWSLFQSAGTQSNASTDERILQLIRGRLRIAREARDAIFNDLVIRPGELQSTLIRTMANDINVALELARNVGVQLSADSEAILTRFRSVVEKFTEPHDGVTTEDMQVLRTEIDRVLREIELKVMNRVYS